MGCICLLLMMMIKVDGRICEHVLMDKGFL